MGKGNYYNERIFNKMGIQQIIYHGDLKCLELLNTSKKKKNILKIVQFRDASVGGNFGGYYMWR